MNNKCSVILALLCLSISYIIFMGLWTSNLKVKQSTSKYQSMPNKTVYQPRFYSLKEIHQLIWQQIHTLQEKGDCEKKKVLLCRNLENYFGFGSNVHQYGVCMQIAYGLGRTFFIHQDEYSHFNGVFQWVKPESKKCGYLKNKYLFNKTNVCYAQNSLCYLSNGYDIDNTHQVMEFNSMKEMAPYPRHIPGTLPEELNKNLLYLGIKTPWLWFTSQFLGYLLLRPNIKFDGTLKLLKKKLNFKSPIVGFHIRHGDKLTSGEAKYVNETLFVNEAENYFHQTDAPRKRVYIATDDIPALHFIRKIAPEFVTLNLPISYLSMGLGNYFQKHFAKEIIESTLLDLHLLSSSDYLVCDVSSNLCRLSYELKQALYPFKQDNILKPIGEEQEVYYRWWNFIYPFSWRFKYEFSAPVGFKYQSGKFLKTYNFKTILYEVINNILSNFLNIKQIGNNEKQFKTKCCEQVDLLEWPGSPCYYYFPCRQKE